MAVFLPGRWRQQPQGPLSLDASNPLVRGLVFASAGTTGYDLVKRAFGTASGSVTRVGTLDGLAFDFAGTSIATSAYLDYGTRALQTLGAATPATWAFLVRVDSTARLNLADCSDGNTSDTGWTVGLSAAANVGAQIQYTTNLRYGTTSLPALGWRTIVITASGSQTVAGTIYYDGVSQTVSVAQTGSGNYNTATVGPKTLYVGRQTYGSAGCLDGAIALAVFANRQWSADEAKRFHENPWGLFRAQPKVRNYWPAGAFLNLVSRPAADSITQWTPSSGAAHYALINEAVADDANYIAAASSGLVDEVQLAPMAAPSSGTTLKVNYRLQGFGNSETVTVSLKEGASRTIKTDTARTAAGDYSISVSSSEWAGTTNWSDIRLSFTSAGGVTIDSNYILWASTDNVAWGSLEKLRWA